MSTDIIHFLSKKLHYYKGDYDTFVNVRTELHKNQRRAYEASAAKKAHMQEFIDKFRSNAKRASLVQSRIKVRCAVSHKLGWPYYLVLYAHNIIPRGLGTCLCGHLGRVLGIPVRGRARHRVPSSRRLSRRVRLLEKQPHTLITYATDEGFGWDCCT